MQKKLQKYVSQHIKSIQEIEDNIFIILGSEAEGTLELDEQGQLLSFSFHNKIIKEELLPIEELINVANQFVKEFDCRTLTLDGFVNVETYFMAIYEKLDDKLGLPIPNSGAMLTISPEGYILSANFYRELYTLLYPEIKLTAEEAKEFIMKEPLIELTIQTEPTYVYTYTPIHTIFGITVDGHLSTADDLTEIELPTWAPLPDIQVYQTLTELLQGNHLTDEIPKIIKVENDAGYNYSVITELNHEVGDPLPYDTLYNKALQVLKTLVVDHYTHYKLEEQVYYDHIFQYSPFRSINKPMEGTEDQFISFRFVYHFEKILLHEYAIEMTMGLRSGCFYNIVVNTIDYDALKLIKKPRISLKTADTIFKNEMSLSLSFERVNLVNNVYSLVYLIDFPRTKAHIEKIDVNTGEITYVETGFIEY